MPTLAATSALTIAAYLAKTFKPVDVGHGALSRGSSAPAYLYFTSSVTLLILPVNRVSAPMPMPSATGVWLSMPTSAVSSAEKMLGCVFSTRAFSDRLSVHGERRLATLAGAAAVVGEVERDGRPDPAGAPAAR